MTDLRQLARRHFLVVTGKGGVGKSSVAASLGQSLTLGGRRKVLIVEVDPRENVHQLFGMPPSGGEVVDVGGGLFLQNLKPRKALDELVRDQLGIDMLARRVVRSDAYHHLAEGAPGFKEVAVLHYAEKRGRQRGRDGFGPFDTVILDAPATGHGVSLLAAPLLLAEVIREGPVGRKAEELARFVRDQERLGVVIVTLAEEMPVQEAQELRDSLSERLGRQPELLVVNSIYPPFDEENPADRGVEGEEGAALAAWYRRRRINERELQRLTDSWHGARAEIPLLPIGRGPELVAALREHLENGLVAEGQSPGGGGSDAR